MASLAFLALMRKSKGSQRCLIGSGDHDHHHHEFELDYVVVVVDDGDDDDDDESNPQYVALSSVGEQCH